MYSACKSCVTQLSHQLLWHPLYHLTGVRVAVATPLFQKFFDAHESLRSSPPRSRVRAIRDFGAIIRKVAGLMPMQTGCHDARLEIERRFS
jgi:hypothetical protein